MAESIPGLLKVLQIRTLGGGEGDISVIFMEALTVPVKLIL